MTQSAPISRYQLQVGLQCRRHLWLLRNEPIEHNPGIWDRLKSNRRQLLDKYLDENAVDGLRFVSGDTWREKVQETQQLIGGNAAAIHMACFDVCGVRLTAELLIRAGNGWRIVELRSAANIRHRHITAAAVTHWGLQAIGMCIDDYRLATINTEWNGIDAEPRFIHNDLTDTIAGRARDLSADLEDILENSPQEMPAPSVGPHCHKPRACAFHDRCHGVAEPSDLDSLYRVKNKVLNQMRRRGIARIEDIPDDITLPTIAERQREAVRTQKAVISDGLSAALATISRPTVYIDFEAIQPALPPWKGCRPFGVIPVQVSLHTLETSGDISHRAWMAEPRTDPRSELAAFLAEHLEGAATLVAYHATFEKNIIARLTGFCSTEQAAVLKQSNSNFVDLLPLMRNHVYHPQFRGRFNLKRVVQALLPDHSYDDLAVKRGDDASRLLEFLLLGNGPSDDTDMEEIRDALLAYCERDTLVLLKLEALLRKMASQT